MPSIVPAALARQQVLAQRADLPERFGVVEDLELLRIRRRERQIERREPRVDLLGGRRRQPGLREHGAQRVDVASRRRSSRERRFDDRRAAAHERVVDDVAGLGEAIDEEARKLRLEARAVRHLVQAVGRALLARPELVDEGLDDDRPRFRQTDARDGAFRWPAVPLERAQLAHDRWVWRRRRARR